MAIVLRSNAVVILVIFCCVLHPIYSLLRNYVLARRAGLCIIVSPVTPYTFQWQLLASRLRPTLEYFQWFRAIDWTCAWHDENKLHQELGLSFIVVSPGLNVLCTSDPKTIEHVLKKWRDFVKPDNVNELLGTFGQNVDTSNGDDWTRHRKLTAPCFAERASSTVWTHALQQSKSLIAQWLSLSSDFTNTMINDTSTLALNVISAVAFENHQVNKPTDGHTLSLREALVTVMSTSISPALEGIMSWLNISGFRLLFPAKVKQLLLAMSEFRQYMDETVSRERAKPTQCEDGRLNLIGTLIKANKADGDEKSRLSDIELRGNIFIFTAGGLESTSITLSYALALLALHPQIQDWVAEEVGQVFSSESADYAKTFPKLKRVMAVMYETLRLFGPSPPLPRSSSTPNTPYILPISTSSSSSINLPGSTQIMLNSWACHASASHFTSPKSFNPKRWITHTQEEETLHYPSLSSAFFAWGSGPRICPGMKFSQVEFCAVLGSVLKSIRVDLVRDTVQGRERMWGVLRDSVAEPLLLHVRRGEEVRLRTVPR
ncbi:cytochrome P450 [Setomelanomma holmii]|uniref:Cytochrome P450 n=1 Tax=Setomelanomma holmii TaxID=210430 RepID=A0A9P4H2N3_9PLEO|nr:cytochrome P450 [Setomelanomma holmii]